MGRWLPDAGGRLQAAAMELFAEQGFAATTVPQIAARAGLTTRTFFRHFADKREVIFAGDEIPRQAAEVLAALPDGEPLGLVLAGLEIIARERCDGRRDEMRLVRELVVGDAGLQERDLRKRADLASAIRAGFEARGVDAGVAALAAETAVTLFSVALEHWLDADDDRSFFDHVLEARGALAGLFAG